MKSLRMSLMHSFVFLPSGVDYGERAVALDDSNADAKMVCIINESASV